MNAGMRAGRLVASVWTAGLVVAGCRAKQEATLIDPPAVREVAPPAATLPATAPGARPMTQPAARQIGTSVEGRSIELLAFADGSSSDDRPVLVIGGIHGSEPTSVW